MVFRHLLVLQVKKAQQVFMEERKLILPSDSVDLHPDFDVNFVPDLPADGLPTVPKAETAQFK